MKKVRQLILFRGLPGSGKSTLAESLCDVVWSADMFFERHGEYIFDPSQIKDAHIWCKECTKMSIHQDVLTIGVANTFTQDWEMEDYIQMAKDFGYRVSTVIVENRHNGKNVHDVPEETIEKMKNRFSIKL